jgi:hypothetical protein
VKHRNGAGLDSAATEIEARTVVSTGKRDGQPSSQNPNQSQILELLAKINAAVRAVNDAETTVTTAQAELVSRSKTVGLLLLEAKKLHPTVADFEAFLKKVHGLKLSRAYDLLRLAGGRTTDEEIRKATRDRVKRHRARKNLRRPAAPTPEPKLSVTSTPVTESAEISIEERKAQHADLDLSAAEQRAAKASAHYLAEFTVAARCYLPKITVEADRQKARLLVFELMSSKPKAGVA